MNALPFLALMAACQQATQSSRGATPAAGEVVAGRRLAPGEVRMGNVREFHPEIEAVDGRGMCRSTPSSSTSGQKMLLMSFNSGSTRARNVSVTLDRSGVPLRYSDLRGDLRAPMHPTVTPDNPIGVRTSIAIDLRDTTAMLSNEQPGLGSRILRVKSPEILTATNLGSPIDMIARIIRECDKS